MTVQVKCPNTSCKYHETEFSVEVPSPIAKKGGESRWKKMTKKQRDAHIAGMTKARLKRAKA